MNHSKISTRSGVKFTMAHLHNTIVLEVEDNEDKFQP